MTRREVERVLTEARPYLAWLGGDPALSTSLMTAMVFPAIGANHGGGVVKEVTPAHRLAELQKIVLFTGPETLKVMKACLTELKKLLCDHDLLREMPVRASAPQAARNVIQFSEAAPRARSRRAR